MAAEGQQSGFSFAILDAEKPQDRDVWLELWQSWPDREVFAHPDYVSLVSLGVGVSKCAVLESDLGVVMYPFVHRPGGMRLEAAGSWSDIVSPYGYGGRYAWSVRNPSKLASEFEQNFGEWCAAERVVSEFVRLSVFRGAILPVTGTVRERGSNIVRELASSEDIIWRDYEAKVRKNVKRARQGGLSVQIDENGQRLEEFHTIYSTTMVRRGASQGYRWPIEWFDELNRTLSGNYRYFFTVRGNVVLSCELVLCSSKSVYSFLGGTNAEAFAERPNDLLKHEVSMWARAEGKECFVLGGGYQPNDGIFKYKRSFAPHGVVPFETAERVRDAKKYKELVEEHHDRMRLKDPAWSAAAEFFPEYRA